MDEIIPVILAGGSGTRLWPLSRKSYPKQFLQIIGDKSLFQESALRLTSSDKIKFKPHITLTNSDFRFLISQQLITVGIDPGPIIIEPDPKNTAPAILSATLFSYKENNNSILLVAPSDHVISDRDKFHEALKAGLKEVHKGKIVTFGIKPTSSETGYGYIKVEKIALNKVEKLVSFVEKPNKQDAEKMFDQGDYFWNSGIFLFRAKDMIAAFKKYTPDILLAVQESMQKAKVDLGFLRLEPNSWAKCKNISIDYAIMEKVENLSVVPFSAGWSDLGDWNTVWQEMEKKKKGVSLSQNAHAFNCSNTLLRSESSNQIVVGLGLKDIIAVAMPDAVLVAHKDMAQEIKTVVTKLKADNINQSEASSIDHRPWGWFENLVISDNFQVKRIHVNSGSALSLQSHNHRSEHWVVVKGTAKVTIEEDVKVITEGESVFVPKRSIHRIENTEKFPIILIEVQIGTYLSEEDIIRYEDVYDRS